MNTPELSLSVCETHMDQMWADLVEVADGLSKNDERWAIPLMLSLLQGPGELRSLPDPLLELVIDFTKAALAETMTRRARRVIEDRSQP